MEKAFEKPVKTPGVKSRADAWLAWEASQLKKYKGPARPKSIFWTRWKATKADLFDIVSYKQYTGEVVYKTVDGHERSVNLMEKDRFTVFNSRYFLDLNVRFKDEYPKLQRARELISRRPWLFEKHGTRWVVTMATILAVVKVVDSLGLEFINKLPRKIVVTRGPTWYDVWDIPDGSEVPMVTMISLESQAKPQRMHYHSTWLLAGGFMATDFYTLIDVLEEKGLFKL